MRKNRKLVIVGDSAFAEIAREYFEVDTDYAIVGFAVESAFRKRTDLHGLPVVDFETVADRYPPQDHELHVAVTYTQLNRLRSRLAAAGKAKGYRLASYISPRAFVWRNVILGEHCFIFEDNTIQPFVTVGNNVVMWSGNHIGHHSRVRDNVFVSSHTVISGFCEVGEHCFVGVNAALANGVKVGHDCWLGPGAIVLSDTEPGQLIRAEATIPSRVSATRFFRVKE